MFNRAKYNLGKFNTISGSIANSNATMLMDMEMLATSSTRFSFKVSNIELVSATSAVATRLFDAGEVDIDFESELVARGTKKLRVIAIEADMISEVIASSFSAFGFESIKLNARGGLVLQPNDELRIDTEKMTVELNGVNVIKHFSSNSEFFKLKPSENILVYTNNIPSSKAQIKVLWKDRWL